MSEWKDLDENILRVWLQQFHLSLNFLGLKENSHGGPDFRPIYISQTSTSCFESTPVYFHSEQVFFIPR